MFMHTVQQGRPDRGPRANLGPWPTFLGPLGLKYMH